MSIVQVSDALGYAGELIDNALREADKSSEKNKMVTVQSFESGIFRVAVRWSWSSPTSPKSRVTPVADAFYPLQNTSIDGFYPFKSVLFDIRVQHKK